ncbi:MAG TPA: hypothetical protein VJU82_03910, partial [Acidobacteriaceae bacterium]|nr:hypothetical protein [Acidobacteriaceae bacterium]
MKSWIRLTACAALAAVAPCVLLLLRTLACGPDFGSEVFVSPHHPDSPAKFAKGQIGILQPGYYHEDLIVAYRYLSGSRLSDAEQAAYAPPTRVVLSPQEWQAYQAARPMTRWLKTRSAFPGAPAPGSISQERRIQRTINGYTFQDSEWNCGDGASANAADTL